MFKPPLPQSESQRISTTDLADVNYVGMNGVTAPCIEAIARIVQEVGSIKNAALLTCNSSHAFLLFGEFGDITAVKSGFSSGYPGEGPRGLATALAILHRHNIDIEEYKVDLLLMHRMDHACLLQSDIDSIMNGRPFRTQRWHDYAYCQNVKLPPENDFVARHYPTPIPFRLLDKRLIDLAVNFHNNPDNALISAYRRLEDIVRKRTSIHGEGVSLFSKAFLNDDSPLTWDVKDKGELKGRANLFISVYMAYRNARVHRESSRHYEDEVREFLLVNELFQMEASSIQRQENDSSKTSMP